LENLINVQRIQDAEDVVIIHIIEEKGIVLIVVLGK
jgi:hypothetical protein